MGLPIRPLNIPELVEGLVERARRGERTTGCYANAHTVNLACRSRRFRSVLTGCDALIADGTPVVWASRWGRGRGVGGELPCRLTAMDYFPHLAARCAAEGLSLYFLGAAEGVAERAAAKVRQGLPAIRIVGASHGHFDLGRSWKIIDRINAARPDVLLLGMSSPRQELWLEKHAEELRVPVRWCVGALFDYLSGKEPRAPEWMRRVHCEWLFRLAVDPQGKWKRYLLGNPLFVWNFLRWRRRAQRRSGATAMAKFRSAES